LTGCCSQLRRFAHESKLFTLRWRKRCSLPLWELWPQPRRRATLRLVVMVSIGVMRVAMEGWRKDGGKRPLAKYLQENFAALEAEI
jgi:hypothetical protein